MSMSRLGITDLAPDRISDALTIDCVRAVSLLLESPRGRTYKTERARYLRGMSRAQERGRRQASALLARATRPLDIVLAQFFFFLCVLPRRFWSKRQTARLAVYAH